MVSTHCSVCRIKFKRGSVPMDSPANSDVKTNCSDWLCIYCWEKIYLSKNYVCPICKCNVKEWITTHYPLDNDSSGDE
jgi:hypothetical protein